MLQTVNDKTMLNDTWFSRGKKAVQIWIPAFSTLYFTLGGIWGLPAVTQVVGTCAAVAVFGGVVLGISSKQYDQSGAANQVSSDEYDGHVVVSTDENDRTAVYLQLEQDPSFFKDKDVVHFKVLPEPE